MDDNIRLASYLVLIDHLLKRGFFLRLSGCVLERHLLAFLLPLQLLFFLSVFLQLAVESFFVGQTQLQRLLPLRNTVVIETA